MIVFKSLFVGMIYFLDSIEYESTLGELRYQGNSVMLSGLGTRVLNYFIEHPNKLINYDELMENVWGRIVTENAVFQVIQHIRQSFKAIKPDGEVIKTIRSKGFQLNQSIVPTEKSSHKKARAMNKWWATVPLVLLIFVAITYWQKNTPVSTNSPNRLIILSDEKNNELSENFAPATAMLLNRILKFSNNSDVVSLERYSTVKERHQTAQQLWQLNPDLNLVTTHLSQQNNQFILTAEMIKGQTGTLKQVFSSDRLSDVLIQTAEWVNLENTQEPLSGVLKSSLPPNVYLIESYMRGLAEAQQGNHSKAIDYFNIVLNERSDFHLARLELAKSFSTKGDFDESKAELETLKSFKLDQNMTLEVEVELASLELRRGEHEKGLLLYNNLVKKYPLEPKYYLIYMNKAIADSLVGNYDQALQELIKLDEVMDPNIYPSHAAVTKVNIGRIYKNQQQPSLSEPYFIDSIQLFGQLNDLQRQGIAYGLLGHYYLVNGQHDLAIKAYDQELQIAKVQDNQRSIITAYDSLVELKIAQGLFDEALIINQLESDGATEIGAPYLQMRATQWAAVISLELGQLDKAKIHIDQMSGLIKELGNSAVLLNGIHIMKLRLSLEDEQLLEAERFIQLLDKMDQKALAQSYYTPLKAQYLAKTSGPKEAIAYLLRQKNILNEQDGGSNLSKIDILLAEQHLSSAPDISIDLLNNMAVNDNNAYPYHWILAQAYNQVGRTAEALLELNKAKIKYNQRWTLEMQQLMTTMIDQT